VDEEKGMIKIVWNRKCKKCKGQMYLDNSEDEDYLVCLQCGHYEKIGDPEMASSLAA
jgi:hypothetical protein